MESHLHKTHIGQVAVVAQEGAAHGLHTVASVVAETRRRVNGKEGFHEVGGVKVAAGLAGYEKVFHLAEKCKRAGKAAFC